MQKVSFNQFIKGIIEYCHLKEIRVQVIPVEGGKPHFVHVTDVKYIMPVDSIIPHLLLPNQFGRVFKYNLNPKNIPDLKWTLSTTLNTKSKTVQVKEEIPDKNTIVFHSS